MYRVNNGIKWLEDLQEYYRERSTIEKEYATKLQAVAKKFRMYRHLCSELTMQRNDVRRRRPP